MLVCCLGLFTWLMSSALFASGMFAFRDAAHYYYPLFQFVSGEWEAGRVPLWNPHENLGQPLAADPTSSVFYPGKLVFALPLDYAWAYKIYVMAHLLLAAWAAYRLARHCRASVEAAGVCAISYAFSGNVLFQYCNVVFLVGAAWLPLAVLAADRMLVEGAGIRGEGTCRVGWAVCLGVILAMMVLGGDPQMAYNAGLLAVMYACWLWWYSSSLSLRQRLRIRAGRAAVCMQRTLKLAPGGSRGFGSRGFGDRRLQRQPPASAGGYWLFALQRCALSLLRSRPALLAMAAVIAFVLAAVQVLPSMEFSRRCGRVANRSVDGLLCRTFEPGTHEEHVYHFSVGPWRLAEYVWPNVSGRQFPVHRRWLDVIPAEGRIWTPSLYMGLLPLLLAVSAMRFRRRRSEPRSPSPRGKHTKQVPKPSRHAGWLALLVGRAGGGGELRLVRAGLADPGDPFRGRW